MSEFPFHLLAPLGVPLLVAWGFLVFQRRQRAAFERDCAAFHDVRAVRRALGQFGLETTRTTPVVALLAAGGGRNNPPHWRVDASLPELGTRTRLHIDREGKLGALREKLGMSDIHIGEADFDRTFCVRGSDADVVRSVLAQQNVQEALWALFTDHHVRYLKLDRDGVLYLWIARPFTSAARAREHALAVAALTTALYHAGRMLPPAGVSGGTGAPVGIALGAPSAG